MSPDAYRWPLPSEPPPELVALIQRCRAEGVALRAVGPFLLPEPLASVLESGQRAVDRAWQQADEARDPAESARLYAVGADLESELLREVADQVLSTLSTRKAA